MSLPANRSIPAASVIPLFTYPDTKAAAEWLCAAFGFRMRLRIGDHRVQLSFGDGALVVVDGPASPGRAATLRVTELDRLYEAAQGLGARSLTPPEDHPYGERQCSLEDPWGYRWTLSQTLADVHPMLWGGEFFF